MNQASQHDNVSFVAKSKPVTRRKIMASIALALFAGPNFTRAKLGAYRARADGRSELVKDRPLVVDPYGEAITSSAFFEYKNGYKIESSSSSSATPAASAATQMKTEVAALARSFQDAMVAMNRNEEDIYVGMLLSASERLADTMRKIGFSQSANDIQGNVRKIRGVYDSAPRDQRDSMPALLGFEIESGVLGSGEDKGRKLPEKSAAMGFLWLGRSLNYQFDMFSHMLDNNTEPYEAASYAYDRDLKPHLSWPLQKMGKAAMTSLKSRRQKELFARIGGFSEECYGNQEEQATKQELRQVMGCLKPMLSTWRKVFSELGLGSI